MGRARGVLLLAPIGALLFLLGGWLLLHRALDAPLRPAGAVLGDLPSGVEAEGAWIEVRNGESFAAVAGRLSAHAWVGSTLPLRIDARLRGYDRAVVPGWYRCHSGEPVRALLDRLRRGEIAQTRLTIPEGWRLERILSAVTDSAWVARDSLEAAARDTSFLRALQVPGPGLEGYLFPETYLLPKGAPARSLLEQMLRPGLAFWRDSLEATAEAAGLDRRQVWTLASIIEAEAATPEERPRISAVFWNRLRRGMRLESDPTVHYALGRPPGRTLFRDLEVDSPYNTYRYPGLPPGPIGSPGRASLRAVLHPEPGCDALFFVARGDGTHVFSRSLAEHNRARARLRR